MLSLLFGVACFTLVFCILSAKANINDRIKDFIVFTWYSAENDLSTIQITDCTTYNNSNKSAEFTRFKSSGYT